MSCHAGPGIKDRRNLDNQGIRTAQFYDTRFGIRHDTGAQNCLTWGRKGNVVRQAGTLERLINSEYGNRPVRPVYRPPDPRSGTNDAGNRFGESDGFLNRHGRPAAGTDSADNQGGGVFQKPLGGMGKCLTQ